MKNAERYFIPRTYEALLKVLPALVMLLVLIPEIGGQTVPQRPKNNNGLIDISEFERLNLSSGSLSFKLPLAGLAGRGIGNGVFLSIDPRWRLDNTQGPSFLDVVVLDPYSSNKIKAEIGGYVHARRSVLATTTAEVCSQEDPERASYVGFAIHFTAYSGGSYTFRSISNDGQPAEFDYNNGCVYGVGQGTEFVSWEDSRVKFISDNAINVDNNPASYSFVVSGKIKLPDGTTLRVDDGLVTEATDRNGNQVQTTYYVDTTGDLPSDQYVHVTSVKDSLNREITVGSDNVEFKGSGGTVREMSVDYTTLPNALASGYSIQTLEQLFPWSWIASTTCETSPQYCTDPEEVSVISGVELPNGQSYRFFYNSHAELARVELPTGGVLEYEYEFAADDSFDRRLKNRWLYSSSTTLESKTEYSYSHYLEGGDPLPSEVWTLVKIKDAAGNLKSQTKHYFAGGVCTPRPSLSEPADTQFYNALAQVSCGQETKTEAFATDGTTVLRRVETSHSPRTTIQFGGPLYFPIDMRTASVQTSLVDAGLVSKVEYSYLSSVGYNLQTDVYEYDYGSSSPGSLLRRTHTDYETGSAYTDISVNILGLAEERWISSDASGSTKLARTVYEYDNYTSDPPHHAALIDRTNVTGHNSTDYGTSNSVRGNVTAVTGYQDAQNQTGGVTAYSRYDILGNIVAMIDQNENVTTISYSDNFGPPDGDLTTNTTPSQITGYGTFAFPTATTNPMNWTAYAQFDYFTGQPVDAQDINGMISSTVYGDALDRPTESVIAISTGSETQTTISYDDDDRFIETTSDLNALDDNLVKSRTYFDGLGRTTETRRYEADGNYRVIQTQYDSLGRAFKTSNPFRPTEIDTNNPILWTETSFDAMGRPIEVETPDGAVAATAYDGNRTLVIDQAGKKRLTKTNAIGHLKEVWEITTSDTWSESVSFPNQSFTTGYKTSYSYDALNNLVTVTQGSQTRTFAYNSLSRLTSAANPESGTISYTYDSNGNLKTKRDARNIKTVYDYDVLSRVIKRCYRSIGTGSLGMTTCVNNNETVEPNTPEVAYTYDNLTNSKGELTKVESSVSTTEYAAFDILGRVTASKQTTDGVTYGNGSTNSLMTYSYNLAGALIEQQYPSGQKVKNVIDNSGDLSLVQARKNSSSGYWNYATSFTYNAARAVTSMQLGNGRWESTTFNSRLQPTQIALGAVQSGYDKLRLRYAYGDWVSGSIDEAKNNGNIVRQIINVPSVGGSNGFEATQKYYYDSLNRIDDAAEDLTPIGGSSTQTWRQDFTYDRYGNRNFVEANTSFAGFDKLCNSNTELCSDLRKKLNPAISTSNNRFSSGQNYGYDSSGNTTDDPNGRQFIYDAENKQVKVLDDQDATIGEYWYDGDGRRVKKYVPHADPEPDEVTIFVYDAAGKLVEEYSTIVASENDAKVAYLTNDHLGSPRINTDANGLVTSRHDYHPFGEEVATPQRTAGPRYAGDDVRKKFTGYERDNESELDFAENRYYNAGHGRFTTTDPLLESGRIENPQTWNRYVYVLNDPINYVDPNGLYECKGSTDECKAFRNDLAAAQAKLADIEKKYGKNSDEYTKAQKALNSYGCESKGGNCVGTDGKALKDTKGKFIKDTASNVHVSFGWNGASPANASTSTATGIVKVQFKGGNHSDFRLIANEGINSADLQSALKTGVSVSKYQSEKDGLFVQAVFTELEDEAAGSISAYFGSTPQEKFTFWKKSWESPDHKAVRAGRESAIVTRLKENYGLSPGDKRPLLRIPKGYKPRR